MCILQRNETIESEAFEKGLAKGKAEAAAKQEETDTQSSAADEVRHFVIFSQIISVFSWYIDGRSMRGPWITITALKVDGSNHTRALTECSLIVHSAAIG